MKLFFLECKKVCKSIIFIFFLIAIVLVWYKNIYGVAENEVKIANGKESIENGLNINRPVLLEPQPGFETYGSKVTENPITIMAGATDSLLTDYQKNVYTTYPIGYYKAVKLNSREQKSVLDILCNITGLNESDLNDLPDDYFPTQNGTIFHLQGDENSEKDDEGSSIILDAGIIMSSGTVDESEKVPIVFKPQVSYEEFKKLMNNVCEIIGKGSEYEENMLVSYYGLSNLTYDEAAKDYNATINYDKVTRGFARMFCDYMVIPMGLIPVFLVTFLFLKDKKNRVDQIIYYRDISTCKLILSKYFAVVIMCLVPVMILSIQPVIVLIEYSAKSGMMVDGLAYLKYVMWWILPTVMLVVSLGMMITVLTETPIAILVQFLYWFVSYGSTGLIGDFVPFNLMIRHNTLEGYAIIQSNIQKIWINRVILVVVSCILIAITIELLKRKRSGKIAWWKKD